MPIEIRKGPPRHLICRRGYPTINHQDPSEFIEIGFTHKHYMQNSAAPTHEGRDQAIGPINGIYLALHDPSRCGSDASYRTYAMLHPDDLLELAKALQDFAEKNRRALDGLRVDLFQKAVQS